MEQFNNMQVNHSSLGKGKKQTSNVRKNKMTNSYVNIPTNNQITGQISSLYPQGGLLNSQG